MLVDTLKEISLANRIDDLERASEDTVVEGDFKGNVTGSWVKLGEMGEGVVLYNNKKYITKPIGFLSIPAGTEVELSFANGIYYSKF